MPKLSVNVDPWLYAEFALRAKQAGVHKTDLHREILIAALAKPRQFPDVVADRRNAESVHKSVRLPAFLDVAVCERAAAKGMSFSRWVSALVQSNLMRAPVLDAQKIEALRASSYEMRMIGINLNQIAHALNIKYEETDRVKLEVFEALIEIIKEHQVKVQQLIRHSQNEWSAGQC
jgi:hypothetical protein